MGKGGEAIVNVDDFKRLLLHGESDWLDYKAELHPGIEQPGADKPTRQEGQGALLKDLMCLANSPSPSRNRYLIRGVKDQKSVRHPLGVPISLDDADVQTWLEGRFDPPLQVQYWQWSLAGERFVGVFEICTRPGVVHVPAKALGKALVEGQVWWRQGSRNTLAGRAGLEVLFGPPRPVMEVGWQLQEGRTSPSVALDGWVGERMRQIEAAFPERLRKAAEHLARMAALPGESVDRPAQVMTMTRFVPTVDAQLDPVELQRLASALAQWGVTLETDLEALSGLWSSQEKIWPTALGGMLTVGGPGRHWYEALVSLVQLLGGLPGELGRVRAQAQQPNVTLQVENIGVGHLPDAQLRLIPLDNAKFHWPLNLVRLMVSPKVGEPRPHPSGASDILLGTLEPQSMLIIPNLPLRRTMGQTSHLRYEIRSRALAQVLTGQVFIF